MVLINNSVINPNRSDDVSQSMMMCHHLVLGSESSDTSSLFLVKLIEVRGRIALIDYLKDMRPN